MNPWMCIQMISAKNHIKFKVDDYVRFSYLVSIDAVDMWEYSRNFEKETWSLDYGQNWCPLL